MSLQQLLADSGLANADQNPWSMQGLESMDALPIISAPPSGRAKLRVTTEAIYDAEVTGTSALTDINWFRAPNGGVMQNATTTKKTLADTNLQVPGSLGSPLLFDLTGFNIKVTPTTVTPVTEADLERVYVGSYFEFLFNNRPFLQMPTIEIPHGVGIDGVSTATNVNQLRNGAPTRSNVFKFTVGKYRVRIRSTENFNARLVWASAATFVVNTKLHLICQGFKYNGI